MHKSHIAEQILGRFTTPQRAASIVGDLMEANERQTTNFWWTVFRTGASFLVYDLTSEPGFLVGLTLRAWLIQLVFMGAFIAALAAASGMLGFQAQAAPHLPVWLFNNMSSVIAATVQFGLGRWIALRARHHEIAGCVAYGIVALFTGDVIG
jgi:hypothetical protein